MGRPAGSKAPPAKLKQGDDKVFGARRPLLNTKLPLNKEVASALAYEAEMERKRKNKKADSIDCKDATEKVVEKVMEVYSRLNIPTIQRHKVKEKVHDFWRLRRETIMNRGAGGKGRKKKNGKVKKKFCGIAENMFNVVDEKNVPDEEKEFLAAQRKPGREGCIGGIDKIVTAARTEAKKKEDMKAKNKEEKERKLDKFRIKSKIDVEKISKVVEVDLGENKEDSDVSDNDFSDPDFKGRLDRKERGEKRKRQKQAEDKIGEVADRFLMSSDAVAHVANSFRVADNTITAEDKDKVINYKKVQRMRKKSRDDKKDKYRGYKVKGLMVDERINENKVEMGVGENNNKRFGIVRSEDCAVIGYPGEVFLGHVAMKGGKGVELATSLDAFLMERGIDITELQVNYRVSF